MPPRHCECPNPQSPGYGEKDAVAQWSNICAIVERAIEVLHSKLRENSSICTRCLGYYFTKDKQEWATFWECQHGERKPGDVKVTTSYSKSHILQQLTKTLCDRLEEEQAKQKKREKEDKILWISAWNEDVLRKSRR